MPSRMISPVTDNMDKQRTYTEQMGRYQHAMSGAFYFEAMLIDYAMMEDRLRSMLYHMAFFANRDSTKAWGKTKPCFQEIVSQYMKDDGKVTLGIKSISGKIKIVRCVLLWTVNTEDGYQNNKYLKALKHQCEGVDIAELLATLSGIEKWCQYRNEVIHSLLNKNIDSLHSELFERAAVGMKYARILDSQVKLLKKGNSIRRSVNAPKEKAVK